MSLEVSYEMAESPGLGDGRPDDGRLDDGRLDDGRSDDGRPDDRRLDDGRPDDGRPDDGQPGGVRLGSGQLEAGKLRRTRSVSERPWAQTDETTPLIGNGHRNGNGRVNYVSVGEEGPLVTREPVKRREKIIFILKHLKIGVLFISAFIFCVTYSAFPNQEYIWLPLSVSKEAPHTMVVDNPTNYPVLKLFVKGRMSYRNPTPFTHNLFIRVTNPATNLSQMVRTVFAPREGDSPEITQTFNLDFTDEPLKDTFVVDVTSNRGAASPVSLFLLPLSSRVQGGVLAAALILTAVYILIMFDLLHRMLAAMLGALAAIAVLASNNEKPSMERVMTWLDFETLCLLFGMMVLVAILVDTGLFDWIALQAYRMTKGKTWPLITTLCIFSAVVSALLDNVTTILLLAPVTIRLCEVLDLDPKHVLIAEVVFSNIGGAATAIGDPPNVLIVSNKDIIDSGIDFGTYTLHMIIGSLLCMIGTYVLLRFIYRKKSLLHRGYPREVSEMKHEAEIWRRAANQIAVTSREENTVRALLLQKVTILEQQIKVRLQKQGEPSYEFFKLQLEEMERRYHIRDTELLTKAGIVLCIVIASFFLTSFVSSQYLSIGWIPILGAVCLLLLADYSDIESILHRIEWATLIFFSALFVMMKALTHLGLIDFITAEMTQMVANLAENQRLPVAIIIILWVSAICSSFIDNIPFTTAMLPVVVKLSGDPSVNLPLQPLVWALAFGACLGGNGTLIGASANVVCAGIAETHGHRFSFWQFFKVGFPTMLVTVTIAMCYLLICHVAFSWHPL